MKKRKKGSIEESILLEVIYTGTSGTLSFFFRLSATFSRVLGIFSDYGATAPSPSRYTVETIRVIPR